MNESKKYKNYWKQSPRYHREYYQKNKKLIHPFCKVCHKKRNNSDFYKYCSSECSKIGLKARKRKWANQNYKKKKKR